MVYQAVKQAREYIEAGNGPMIVEAKTYRVGGDFYGDVGRTGRGTSSTATATVDVLRRYVDDRRPARSRPLPSRAADAAEKVSPGRSGSDAIFKNLYAEKGTLHDGNDGPAPGEKKLRYQQCIGLAIELETARDERVFAMGQDVTTMGGEFGLSRGLIDKSGGN